MNSMKLKAKIKNKVSESNISFNVLLRMYMYERFIERLSVSAYRDNFILKGGFYLSSLFGLEKRTTMDIDAAFKDAIFTKENILKMLEEIITIDLEDNITFSISDISLIRQEDRYGGYRFEIISKLENIREIFSLDIATGDPITPKEISYSYKTLFDDKVIKVWAYNIETVLAEKLETVLSRGELNGRMKDFYDIYLIYNLYYDKINLLDLKNAVNKTFSKRGYSGTISVAMDVIRNSKMLKLRWNSYARKNGYIKEIKFDEVLNTLGKIVTEIFATTI